MTLKDIAKQLTTAVQTVPNLVQILRDGFAGMEEESGGIDYSTEEQDTGLKWIDGAKVYQKTITGTTAATGTATTIDLSSLSFKDIIKADLLITATTNQATTYYVAATDFIRWYTSGTDFILDYGSTSPAKPIAYRITLQYTKTTT